MDLLPGPDDALTRVDEHGGTDRGIIQVVTDLKAFDPATRSAIAAVIHAVARAQEDHAPTQDVA